MRTKVNGKIGYILQAINILPLIAFGILIMLLGTHWFTKSMYNEVEQDLHNVACSITTMLDALYPGDYHLVGEAELQLYKGEYNLTGDYALIDRIQEETGLDVTLFYHDTRILTTVTDTNGWRIVGSGAPDVVIQEVLYSEEPRFYYNSLIYGTSYFSYYTPLYNEDGSVTGILFVGKPSAKVDAAIQSSIYPLIIGDAILILIVSAITFLYNKSFASCLMQIHGFLKEVSSGNLNAQLDSRTRRRRDELGEIALSALNMQRSLRNLVNEDALTSLPNRRSGSQQLQKVIADSSANNTPFCVSIGDIDFFKKVNDTYGHECGDLVLQKVADILRQHVNSNGFVARWGGEEFLLVFKTELAEAASILVSLLEDIRRTEILYNSQIVKITMTFGVIPGDSDDVKDLLRGADQKLYTGKSTGRNIVIC